MSATEILRRLLDEQGIEYREYQPNPFEETTAWDLDVSDIRHEVFASFEEFDRGSTLLRFWNCTPEQAIAATLGRRTCHVETTENCLPAERYHRCKHCGAFFAVLDASGDIPPRVCPNCGRKVVVE